MSQDKRIDVTQIKKVPSIFSFSLDFHLDNPMSQVQFFRDTLQNLEIAYRNTNLTIHRQDLIAEMRRAHLIYDEQGLNFLHWLVHYTQNFGVEHLDFFKYLYELGIEFDVRDRHGYHLLDLAIFKGNLILIKWLIEVVHLDIDDERWDIHPLVRTYNKYQKKLALEQFMPIEKLISHYMPSHASSGNHILIMAIRANDLGMVKWVLSLRKHGDMLAHKNHAGKNALMYAVMYAEQEIVNYIIDQNINMDESDLSGRHILHYFANFGYLDWIQAFEVSTGCDLREYKDNDGCSVLFYAVQSSNLELVKYLIEKEFEISHAPESRFSIPLYACKSKNVEIAKWLLEQGHIQLYRRQEDGSLTWLVDDHNRHALHYAAGGQSYGVTKWLVEEHRADIEFRDNEGANVLLSALTQDETEESYMVVEYLINCGAEKTLTVKCLVENEYSAICEMFQDFDLPFSHALIMKRHFKTLFKLLEKEDLDVRDINHLNQNVFDMIMMLKNPQHIESMRLFLIAYNLRHIHNMINPKNFLGYPILAEHLISRKLLSLRDYDGDGDALIHTIVKFGEIEGAVQYIASLENLNINFKTEYGESVLSLIVARNHFELFKQLIETFAKKLDFSYINPRGQHLFELLKEDGKQSWIDWMSQQSTLSLKSEEQLDLCFEVFENQSFKEVLKFCHRMGYDHWVSTRKSDHKKPLAILVGRFQDQEILQILKKFSKYQVLTKLNDMQENFIEILRANHRQILLNDFLSNPIKDLHVFSLLSEVCQKEPRAFVIEFCKNYVDVNLNQAVGLKLPLQLIFERKDDELLKKFVSQFYGTRLSLERMDKEGRHFLDYLRKERRNLLNWFCNQKNIAPLPLSDEALFEECIEVYAGKSDWQRYLFNSYMTPCKQQEFIHELIIKNQYEVLIAYLKNKLLPYDGKDILEHNLLTQVLVRRNYDFFERLMYDFYMSHPNTATLLKETFQFYQNNPSIFPKEKWIQMMLNTHDKILLEFVIKELDYDWKTPNEKGLNLVDALYQSNQISALEWLICECHVRLSDTQYLNILKEKSFVELKSFLGIFRKVFVTRHFKTQLMDFDFELVEAAIKHLDTSQALEIFKDVVYWHHINGHHQTLLHVCVLKHRFDLLDYVLEKMRPLLNHQDDEQKTALHYAIEYHFDDMVEVLLPTPGIQLELHDMNSKHLYGFFDKMPMALSSTSLSLHLKK